MNSVNIVARLTRNPESRTTTSDRSVCGMRVAIDRPRSDGADFVDVTAFGKLADVCMEYLEKGRQVAIEGRLHYSEWQADGAKRSKHELIAQQITFLSRGQQADAEEPELAAAGQETEPEL